MSYCKNCGSELASGESSCQKCSESAKSNTLQVSKMKHEKLRSKKRNKLVWIIVGATSAIIIVALFVLFVVILPTGDDDADAAISMHQTKELADLQTDPPTATTTNSPTPVPTVSPTPTPTVEVETGPILSTSVGDFTYTQMFSDKYDDRTANSGYIFLIIELIPIDGQKIRISSIENFTFRHAKAILGDEEYPMNYASWHIEEGFIVGAHIAFGMPEGKKGDIAVILLPKDQN